VKGTEADGVAFIAAQDPSSRAPRVRAREVPRTVVADALLLLQALEAIGPAKPASSHRHAIEPVADPADVPRAGDVGPHLNSLRVQPPDELAHRGRVLRSVADQSLELLLLGNLATVSRHPILAPRGRSVLGRRARAPYRPKPEVPLNCSTGLLVADVLAPLLRDHRPIGSDPVEEDVAVLLLLVAVPNDDVLEPVEVMAPA